MKHSIIVSACLLALVPAAPASAQQGQLKIAYDEPSNAQLRPVYERLKQRHVLEELQAFMTPLRLPHDITVRTAQCDASNLPYKPQGPVTVCYELVEQIGKIVVEHTKPDDGNRPRYIVGAFIEAVLHETAYAIFDVLQVPIWGREYDAADRLAALIMVQFGDDTMTATIDGTLNLFLWSNQTWTGAAFAAPESPGAQRFYNFLCVAYASDPNAYQHLVGGRLLPKHRAERCPDEYAQIKKAFDLRIMPNVDADALIKVRATSWLTWKPEK